MNFIKTPQEKLLEEAGAVPATPGMIKTPQQALLGAAGVSPQDMLAQLMVQGQMPQHFLSGGTVKNIAAQSALAAPMLAEDAQAIAQDIKSQKYPEALARTAGTAFSAFTPLNPLTMLISGLTYAPEVGDATLDAWLKQKEAEQAARQPTPKREDKHHIIPFTETRFYKQ
jgi:hypothetical protein